ncbi:class I SAM-dependent methyltransferase [Balneolaceae bacterium ANBcel3]|nr:class I SAM-dependent methyltransferase [Balneolaceae bacterium ANBcel3]
MIDYKKIENILQCPITNEKVKYYEKYNDLGSINNMIDEINYESAFVNESKTVLYPIKNNIAVFLPDYAITSLDFKTNTDILSVKSFYDNFGWKKSNDNKYNDNLLFVSQESFSKKYLSQTTRRVNHFLQNNGEYLLDIASGPVYQDEYKAFSNNFTHRICIDISITALEEAQKNLKEQNAFYILGDITNIPLRNESCDNVISMHTLYHVVKDRQMIGVKELVRVCKTGANIVIAYNWAWHSMLMNVVLLPKRTIQLFSRIKKTLFKTTRAKGRKTAMGLYFYSYSRRYFLKNKPVNTNIKFTVLKSLHQDFIQTYLKDNERSRKFLDRIFKIENKYSSFFGRHGAYPLIVIEKLLPTKNKVIGN